MHPCQIFLSFFLPKLCIREYTQSEFCFNWVRIGIFADFNHYFSSLCYNFSILFNLGTGHCFLHIFLNWIHWTFLWQKLSSCRNCLRSFLLLLVSLREASSDLYCLSYSSMIMSIVIKSCKIKAYADDLKLYMTINSMADRVLLQDNLDAFYMWCVTNEMIFNVNKCATLTFSRRVTRDDYFQYSIGGRILNRVEQIRYIGVILDAKLNFKSHIDRICNSSHAIWGLSRR